MKAALLGLDGPHVADVPRPSPKAGEILVAVGAASLNRADLLMAQGRVHGSHGGVGTPLGLEWAGTVIECGEGVSRFREGDRVMCSGIGGFAEFAVTDAHRALALPSPAMDDATAACMTIALRTTHLALVGLGQLRPAQSLLILGASSAVGLMCLQAARLLGAGRIIGTSTHAERRARLAEFGASATVDTNDAAWADQVLEQTAGRGVDLVVDFLAGPLINQTMRATSLGGCIVNVGRMAGDHGAFDFDLHSLRRIRYLGTTFRTRSAQEVGEIGERVVADFWPAVRDGKLSLPIDVRLPLSRVAEAFDLMRRNAHFGKIVLIPDQRWTKGG